MVTRINTGISRRKVMDFTASGVISAVIPNTKPTLAIFEPSTLPIPKSRLPSSAATAATIISGSEVPRLTMVKPITIGGTRRFRANAAAPSTKRSAPQISKATPTTMARHAKSISALTESKLHGIFRPFCAQSLRGLQAPAHTYPTPASPASHE